MKPKTTRTMQPTSFRLPVKVLAKAKKRARVSGDSLAEVVTASLEKYSSGGFRLGACDHLKLKTSPFPGGHSPIPLQEWGLVE
jgi:hypothetical protein